MCVAILPFKLSKSKVSVYFLSKTPSAVQDIIFPIWPEPSELNTTLLFANSALPSEYIFQGIVATPLLYILE